MVLPASEQNSVGTQHICLCYFLKLPYLVFFLPSMDGFQTKGIESENNTEGIKNDVAAPVSPLLHVKLSVFDLRRSSVIYCISAWSY